MKIIFLCGSLEPGKDGVGDYTKRLACELIKQGHSIGVIALKDRYVSKVFDGYELFEGIKLPILRLSSSVSSSRRYDLAKTWINGFRPDWLSFQFVIFSYQSKGLPFGLSTKLASLNETGIKWDIMFHELWLGLNGNLTKKMVVWGYVQKLLIRQLINKLKPVITHTHSRIYISSLRKLRQETEHLPLFGNIPVTSKIPGEKNNSFINLVIFGTIHPDAQAGPPAKEAAHYSKKYGVKINLIFIGRCGIKEQHWSSVWKSHGVSVEHMGEQTAEKVSEVLSNATYGISTCNLSLIEKSGTVAAMREHGLPVICVADRWQVTDVGGLSTLAGVSEYRLGNLEALFLNHKHKLSIENTLEIVSKKFINDLSKYD